MYRLCAVVALFTTSSAFAQEDYLELSFTGDGKTPSALALYTAQDRGPKPVDFGAEAGDQGDLTYSVGITLPPAHLQPQVALSYSSSAGSHSWLGRGWSLTTGVTMTRVTGRQAVDAYDGVEVYRVQGGGYDGLIHNGAVGWTYHSSTPAVVSVAFDGITWTLEKDGVVSELKTHETGAAPVSWRVVRQEDRSGNEVLYTWNANKLNKIEYGGTATTPIYGDPAIGGAAHHIVVDFVYDNDGVAVSPAPTSRQARSGYVDVIDGRLVGIDIITDSVPRHGYELEYSSATSAGRPYLEELLSAVDEVDSSTGALRRIADLEYTSYDGEASYHLPADTSPESVPAQLSVNTKHVKHPTDPNTSHVWAGMYDISGDGLQDQLLVDNGVPGFGWFLWSLGQGYEDVLTAPRTFQRPSGLDTALETDLNIRIDEDVYSPTDVEHRWATYAQKRIIDLNGDGFQDLLVSTVPLDDFDSAGVGAYSNNLLTGAYTWQVYYGGRNGFATTPVDLDAPFKSSRIGRNPYIPDGRRHQVASTYPHEGNVVDLMDINGDGYQDVVYTDVYPSGTGAELWVWYFDPEAGSWPSALAYEVVSSVSMNSSLRSLSSSTAYMAVASYKIEEGVWYEQYQVDHMEKVRGFHDLNGDGFVDFVDTTDWSLGDPEWEVWLGDGAGFADLPIAWPAPAAYLSESLEGTPQLQACTAQTIDFSGNPQPLAADSPTGALDQPPELSQQSGEGPCEDSLGARQQVRISLLDMDGDGRQDLVDFPAGEWWKNTGAGFAPLPELVPSWFPRAQAESLTSQSVSSPDYYEAGVPISEQGFSSSASRTEQEYQVADFDQNGLPDLIAPVTGAEVFAGATWSTAPRPALLEKVVRGPGATTTVTYLSSAEVAPSGVDDGRLHEMAAHRPLVAELEVTEPHTDQSARRVFSYDQGICKDGGCWGFEQRTVHSYRHDPLIGASGSDDLMLVTETSYKLGRDWALPDLTTYSLDWNGMWLGDDARGLGVALAPRFVVDHEYRVVSAGGLLTSCVPSPVLGMSNSQCWVHARTTTEHGWGGSGATRSVRTQIDYGPNGNVLHVGVDDLGGTEDDVDLYTEYVSDAANKLYLPSRQYTVADGVTVEEGLFSYDDQPWGSDLTIGRLTSQDVCSGLPGASICGETLTWQFSWYGRGALEIVTEPTGAITWSQFLQFGDLLPGTETNAEGHLVDTYYDALGRAVETVDPNEVSTRKELDAFGRPVREFKTGRGVGVAEYETAQYVYHDTAYPQYVEIIRSTYPTPDPASRVTYTEYEVLDGLGRPFQTWRRDEHDAGWIVTEKVVNLSGDLLYEGHPHREAVFDPSLRATATGRRELRDPWGEKWLGWEDYFNSHGRTEVFFPEPGVVRVEDADGRVHENHHDAHGRLRTVLEGDTSGLLTTGNYERDGRGRVTAFTDGDGNTYFYTFDGAGRQRTVQRQAPGGLVEDYYAFVYSGPNPIEMYEGMVSGTPVVQWTYDLLGRTTQKLVADGNGGTDVYEWFWDYDALSDPLWIGSRSRITDPSGGQTYSYDDTPWGGFGQLTRTKRFWNTTQPDTYFHHEYDFAGNTIRTTFPSGAEVEATYSVTGWLSDQQISWDPGTGTRTATLQHSYDGWGLPAGWTGGEGSDIFTVAMTRHSPTREKKLSWTLPTGVERTLEWTWSDGGLLQRKSVDGSMEGIDYTYDSLRRIVGVWNNGMELEGYSYSTAGVPLERRHLHAGTTTYAVPSGFHEVPSTSNGLLSDAFTWAAGTGRLANRTVSVGSAVQRTTDFAFDGAGRLVEIDALEGSVSEVTTFAYDVDDVVVLEDRVEGAGLTRIYRNNGWRREATVGQPATVIEELLPVVKLVDGDLRWTTLEPDGHAWLTIASDGTVLTEELTGVFGAELANDAGGTFATAAKWKIEGLHGLDVDDGHGVAHAGARHFMTDSGMWLQPEPLLHYGFHAGELTQPLSFGGVYAGANTNSWSDPGGYVFETPWDAMNVALGAGSLASNLTGGNWGAAALDGAGIAYDSLATLAPGMVGGAGTLINGARAADKGAGFLTLAREVAESLGKKVDDLGAGGCFVAGNEVQLIYSLPIEQVREGDRVVASATAAASTDGGEEPWVEVASATTARSGAWAPRAVAMACAMLVSCDLAELPAADEIVQVYDARTGEWFEAVGAELEVEDTYVDDGRVLRVVEDGVEVRGEASVEDLAEADATWVAEAAHRVPGGDDWVLVLGDADDAGHWRLSEVEPGERFAFQGRVFESADVDADGHLEVRATGDVLGRVVNTFVRVAPEVIDAEITYADGTTDTLTGTPNHPFWVDAVREYVPLGELEVGTVLHVQGDGEAIFVSKTWRQGDFEVFDFEVQGFHNFYVRGEGTDAAGVLVHNSTPKVPGAPKAPDAPNTPDLAPASTPDAGNVPAEAAGHRKKRPSTKEKHEKGDERRQRDAGGEKGDKARQPPRKPPPGHKGPWPPKK